eukprot:COSAG02_NODE_2210_length_9492_cov_22.862877_10_plen_1095_part_00
MLGPSRYYHHGHAREVDLSGTQCSAWSDNACCSAETAAAMDYDVADEDTGLPDDAHGLGIDQCGIPSRACQKWFIAESCLYECDVNAGRYRHHDGDAACEEGANGWQMSGFPLKQSEVDQFYQDCADEMFCFGTVDTCTGTIAGSDLADAEDGGDCATYFASHTGWGRAAACDGSDPTECAAACPAGCTYFVSTTENTAGVTADRGLWNRASGCVDVNTGCKSMSTLYDDSIEMVAELWAYGTEPAFTVVATADETATNSFSLFGGDSPTDTDFTDAPADQANPNDDVCLAGDCAQLFPTEASCTHAVDCVVEASACTSACERDVERSIVVTIASAYGGAACPQLQLTHCSNGEGECAHDQECTLDADCHASATCVDQECVCNSGFLGDGVNTCIEVWLPPVVCVENEYASGGECLPCAAGTTSVAMTGDIDANTADTSCTATLCEANERVLANQCVPCPAATESVEGADASGADTQCTDIPVTGMCVGNTDSASDVTCGEDFLLKPDPETVEGTTTDACCDELPDETEDPPEVSYAWEATAWGVCEFKCGARASLTRTVKCMQLTVYGNGAVARAEASADDCEGDGPAATQACPTLPVGTICDDDYDATTGDACTAAGVCEGRQVLKSMLVFAVPAELFALPPVDASPEEVAASPVAVALAGSIRDLLAASLGDGINVVILRVLAAGALVVHYSFEVPPYVVVTDDIKESAAADIAYISPALPKTDGTTEQLPPPYVEPFKSYSYSRTAGCTPGSGCSNACGYEGEVTADVYTCLQDGQAVAAVSCVDAGIGDVPQSETVCCPPASDAACVASAAQINLGRRGPSGVLCSEVVGAESAANVVGSPVRLACDDTLNENGAPALDLVQPGQFLFVECESRCSSGVIGTQIYSADSTICAAARHSCGHEAQHEQEVSCEWDGWKTFALVLRDGRSSYSSTRATVSLEPERVIFSASGAPTDRSFQIIPHDCVLPLPEPCRQPVDLQGYLRPIERDLNRTTFNVTTACAYGYRGKPEGSACAHPGEEYRLAGCSVAPSCSAAGTCTAAIASGHLRCDAKAAHCGALPAGLAEAYTLSGSSDVRTHSFEHTFEAICAN